MLLSLWPIAIRKSDSPAELTASALDPFKRRYSARSLSPLLTASTIGSSALAGRVLVMTFCEPVAVTESRTAILPPRPAPFSSCSLIPGMTTATGLRNVEYSMRLSNADISTTAMTPESTRPTPVQPHKGTRRRTPARSVDRASAWQKRSATGTPKAAARASRVSADPAPSISTRCTVRTLNPDALARCSCDHDFCSLRARTASALIFICASICPRMSDQKPVNMREPQICTTTNSSQSRDRKLTLWPNPYDRNGSILLVLSIVPRSRR